MNHDENFDTSFDSQKAGWKTGLASTCIHAVIIFFALISVTENKREAPKKLLVHTVSLSKPQLQQLDAPPQVIIEPVIEEIKEAEPIQEVREEIEKEELIVESEEVPLPPKPEPKPKPKPEYTPPEYKQEVKEKPQPTPKPKTKEREREKPVKKATKPVVKKAPPKTKSKVPPKVQKKSPPNKEKAKDEARERDKARAKEQAKKEADEQAKRQKREQEKKSALIADALSSLDNSEKVSSQRKNLQEKGSSNTTKGPSRVESLASDSYASNTAGSMTKEERSYESELVSRLKLTLHLPEYGDVKVKLTVSRQGKVLKAVVVSSKSSRNKEYAQKTLPGISFPRFGTNFKGHEQHTFDLCLSNDLN